MRGWVLASLLVLVSYLIMIWGGWLMSKEQHRAKQEERSWQWKEEWEKDEQGEYLGSTWRYFHVHYCLVCRQGRDCEVEHPRTRRQPLGDGPYGLPCPGCVGKTREVHVCRSCEEEWTCIKAHRWLWECGICPKCDAT